MRPLLAALLLSMMSIPAHAASLHLCPQAGEQAERPGCRSIALPPGARVETLFPLAPNEDVERTILLHGRVRDGRFSISEHVLPSSREGTPGPGPMPLRANLLERMQARAFGVEERVNVDRERGRLTVECRAGTRPACRSSR
jgi:hypothetical protein